MKCWQKFAIASALLAGFSAYAQEANKLPTFTDITEQAGITFKHS